MDDDGIWNRDVEMERERGGRERFLRWLLRVKNRTLGYMIREVLKREKMRSRAAKKACDFVRRLEEVGEDMFRAELGFTCNASPYACKHSRDDSSQEHSYYK